MVSARRVLQVTEQIEREREEQRQQRRQRPRSENKTYERKWGAKLKEDLEPGEVYKYSALRVLIVLKGGSWKALGSILTQMVRDDILDRVGVGKYKLKGRTR